MLEVINQYPKFAKQFLKTFPALPAIQNEKIRSLVYVPKALSRNSPNVKNNENLEFLGDCVLNLVVSDCLMIKYPHLKEGDLTHLKNLLTNNTVLRQYAIAYKLHETPEYKQVLKISPDINDKVLADMFEAYVGGVYKDNGSNGLPLTKSWLKKLMAPLTDYYCTIYGYKKIDSSYLTRYLNKEVPVNPISSFNKNVDETVEHCPLVEPVDLEAKNVLHGLFQKSNCTKVKFKLLDNIPIDSPINLTRNGCDLKVHLIMIGDVVCASGEGFSIQSSQSRCAMAFLKTVNRLKKKKNSQSDIKGHLKTIKNAIEGSIS